MESKFSISDDDPKVIASLLREMIKDLSLAHNFFEDADKLVLYLKEKTISSKEKIDFEIERYGSMCCIGKLVICIHFGCEEPKNDVNYFPIKIIYRK